MRFNALLRAFTKECLIGRKFSQCDHTSGRSAFILAASRARSAAISLGRVSTFGHGKKCQPIALKHASIEE